LVDSAVQDRQTWTLYTTKKEKNKQKQTTNISAVTQCKTKLTFMSTLHYDITDCLSWFLPRCMDCRRGLAMRIFTIDRRVLHFNALAGEGVFPCEYRHK